MIFVSSTWTGTSRMDTAKKATAAVERVNDTQIAVPQFIAEVRRVLEKNEGTGFCDVCLMRYAPAAPVTRISALLNLLCRYFPTPQHGRCADCGETTLVVSAQTTMG